MPVIRSTGKNGLPVVPQIGCLRTWAAVAGAMLLRLQGRDIGPKFPQAIDNASKVLSRPSELVVILRY